MRTKRWYLYPLVVAAMFMMWSAPAGAVITQAPGDMGDVLLGASYDMQAQPFDREGERTDAWENFIEIQNTSNDWVAVHLRFRESEKSLEVWDHPILLSPKDVFWAYMVRNDQGQVEFRSSDFRTLYHSGLIDKAQFEAEQEFNPANNGDLAVFSPFLIAMSKGIANPTSADYTAEMWERTQLGYMEAIGLWEFDGTAPDNYPSDDGLTHSLEFVSEFPGKGIISPYTYTRDKMADSANIFDILENVWGDAVDHPAVQGNDNPINRKEVAAADDYYRFDPINLEDADNVLKGTIEMGDITTGQYIVNNMVALQDFRDDIAEEAAGDYRDETSWGPIVYHPDLYLSGRPFANLGDDYPFVYTDIAYYLNPDWATTKGPTLRDGDMTGFDKNELNEDQSFNDGWSLYAVEDALAKDDIWTFYLNDTPFRTSWYETDITMTMPTKHLHFGVEFIGQTDEFQAFPLTPTGFFPYWNDGTYTKTSNAQNIQDYLSDVALARAIVGESCTADVRYDGYIWDTDETSPYPFKEKSPEYASFELSWPYESFIFRISEFFSINETDYNDFAMGQINFSNWTMEDGQRGFDTATNATTGVVSTTTNQVPIIGFTSRVHQYELEEEGGSAVLPYRSASHPWQWDVNGTSVNSTGP